MTLLTTTLYFVATKLPPVIGSFRFFWAPISIVIILLKQPKLLIKRTVFMLLIYGIVFLFFFQKTIWIHMDSWNISLLNEEFYTISVFLLMLHYYWSQNKIWKLAFISRWLFIFIVITIVLTHFALFINGNIVRDSANSFSNNPEVLVIAERFGTAGYGYAQSFVILIPILVYFIKQKQNIWFFNYKMIFGVLVLLVVLLLRANVFANILVGVSVLIISFIGPKRSRMSFLSISVISIFMISIPSVIYSDFIISLSKYFSPNSITYEKLLDFAAFIEFPELDAETQAASRVARYPLLIDAFIHSPLLGYAFKNNTLNIGVGGHLYWMNKLTTTGIIGFLYFTSMIYLIFKKAHSAFDNKFKYYYILSIISFICLGLTKNIAGREPWLMLILIIPGLFFLQKIENEKNENCFSQIL